MEVSKISLKLWPDLTPMSTPRVQHEKEVRLIRYRSLPKGNNTIYHEWKWKKKTEKSFCPIGCAVNDNLTTAWQLSDDCLTTAWQLPNDCLTAWRLLDDRLTTDWQLPDDFLTAAWRLPDNCLTNLWPPMEPHIMLWQLYDKVQLAASRIIDRQQDNNKTKTICLWGCM